MKHHCVVIGSGIAGLAAAIRLAAKGNDVHVYEANETPGGKIAEHKAAGYRFDRGPSVLMLPQLIDELFILSGKNPQDYFRYKEVGQPFKYFYGDGTVINAYSDTELFAEELSAKTGLTKNKFRQYLKDVATKYKITREVFIENSLHIPSNFLNWRTLYGILNFHKIDSFITMNEGNKKFFGEKKLVQLFNTYATYVGSNPFTAPATLNVIQHLEINLGVYLPENGMYSIVEALVQLATELGVKFHFNTRVTEIILEENKIKGIKLADENVIYCDRVVSNMDVYYTYQRLLPKEKKPRILSQPKSSSAICFYWGMNRSFSELGLHNMFFSENEATQYKAVFEEQNISSDPDIYLFITSKEIPSDAPEGCENWFVMITAPNNQGQDWQEIIDRTRKNVIQKFNRILHADIESCIVTEDLLTPAIIEENYASAFGAIYGNSSNSRYAAFLRHANFSKKIKGLYFVGGSVHPGAGLPMCLNSAKIMAKHFS